MEASKLYKNKKWLSIGGANKKVFSIEKIFLIISMFPFVSPLPTETDVQPLVFCMSILVLIKHNLVFKKNQYIIMLFCILSMCYININFSLSNVVFSKIIAPLFGVIFLFAFEISKGSLNASILNKVISIYFIFSILTLIFPNEMIALQSHLVRQVKVTDVLGYRGIAVFATEPGLLAGLILYFILLNDHIHGKEEINIYRYLINMTMLCLIMLMTRSGTGVVLLLLYLVYKFKKIRIFELSLITLIMLICLYFVSNTSMFAESRGVLILHKLIFNPYLLVMDSSLFTRINTIIAGFISLYSHPFGVGINGVGYYFIKTISDHSYFKQFEHFIYSVNTGNQKITLVSSLADLIFKYGIFSLFALGYLYFNYSNSKPFYKIVSFIFVSVSYSLAFPPIWALLVLS